MTVSLTSRLPLTQRPEFRRLLHGFGWALTSIVLGRLATLAAGIVVARVLGRDAYGELALLQSTVMMLGELGGLGVSVAAARLLGQFRASHPERASGVITLNLLVPALVSTVLAGLLWYFREPLAILVLDNERLAPLLKFIAVSLLVATISGAMTGILNGLEHFRAAAWMTLSISAMTAAGQVAAVLDFGIEGVLAAGIVANVAGILMASWRLRSVLHQLRLRIDFALARRELPSVWHVNLPAMLSSLMVVPVTWAASVLLARQPQGYAELAAFNIANQWKMAMMIAPAALANVLLPTMARLASAADRSRYQSSVRTQLLAAGIGAFVIVSVMCATVPWLLQLYGAEYADERPVFWLLFLVAGLMAINTVIGNAITSSGWLWLGFFLNAAWATVLLASAWSLSPRWGAAGLAAAYVIAYLAHTLWQGITLRYRVFQASE